MKNEEKKENFMKKAFRDMKENAKAQHLAKHSFA